MDVLSIIYQSIDEMNEGLEPDEQLEKSESAAIFGPKSPLDSIGLINLITLIEERVEAETGNYVPIADEQAMSLSESPFRTVGTLKNYLESLLS